MNFPQNNGYKGRPLETAVITSQKRVILVDKTEPMVKFLRGGEKKIIKGSVDFIGVVVGSGRGIYFDAKMTAEPRGFAYALCKSHQINQLADFHEAGAIAGVLAECTEATVAGFFWIDFPIIKDAMLRNAKVIPWAHCFRLGPTTHLIDFTRVPGVAPEAVRR